MKMIDRATAEKIRGLFPKAYAGFTDEQRQLWNKTLGPLNPDWIQQACERVAVGPWHPDSLLRKILEMIGEIRREAAAATAGLKAADASASAWNEEDAEREHRDRIAELQRLPEKIVRLAKESLGQRKLGPSDLSMGDWTQGQVGAIWAIATGPACVGCKHRPCDCTDAEVRQLCREAEPAHLAEAIVDETNPPLSEAWTGNGHIPIPPGPARKHGEGHLGLSKTWHKAAAKRRERFLIDAELANRGESWQA